MAIKRTHKMRLLAEIFRTDKRFQGIDIEAEEMTNALAVDIANSAGYSWNRKQQVWFLSSKRIEYLSYKSRVAQAGLVGNVKMQIRLMGPLSEIEDIRGAFIEVVDLIGLSVIKSTPPRRLHGNSTWGKVYITVERTA